MPAANGQPPVKLSLPLQFQQEIYTLLRAEDVLIILAKGLGLLRIVTNLLHSYDVAGNSLVILVGADDRENEWIGEALAEQHATSRSPLSKGLRVINTDKATVSMREKIYADGGVVSVTSRILIVDLLSKLLDPETVTGLVVLHAERVVATSVEAFIVREFRNNNKIGFLKAFCDAPEPLISSYAPLAAMMKNLFLRRPSIWPRFHASVAQSLEGKRKAEVIELEVPMSEDMLTIQQAVLECIDASIGELRKANTGVEMDDWTTESALHTNFDAIVRRQLDPVWHRVSWRTKEIANDLTTLRSILHALLYYDCVSLLKYLDTVLASHSPPPGATRQNQSPWLFLDAANTIFHTAKARVYSGSVKDKEALPSINLPDTLTPVLEEQPKWAVLSEVLDEIEAEQYFNPKIRDGSNNSVLIMCNDQQTCRQLREYLELMHTKPLPQDVNDGAAPHQEAEENEKGSAEFMLRRKLREYLIWRKAFAQVSAQLFEANQKSMQDIKSHGVNPRLGNKALTNKRRRVRGGAAGGFGRTASGAVGQSADKDSQLNGLLADLPATDGENMHRDDVVIDDLIDATDDFFELYDPADQIVIHPFSGDADDLLLEEVRPKYIIMFSPNLEFSRRVEVYRSSHMSSDLAVRVYHLFYTNSVEEKRYYGAVRREKDAFTKLIRERGSMAVTLSDTNVSDQEQFLRTVNTRIAGGGRLAATASPPTVVVDVREFRSALPSLLHGRNMQIVPCQLTVGDYVLSPQIAIERKSISDLISSFKSGRLFNQAETLLKHYKYPFLLIEFAQNKSFTLDPFADLTSSLSNLKIPDTETRDLQSKLALLTLSFPRLKIIWSSSPFQTAQIFEELKKQQEEPDPLKAVRIGLEEGEDEGERTFNSAPQDLLRAIPGVSNKNASRLYLEARDVKEVANMELKAFDHLVGREVGRQVVRFFTRSVVDDEAAT
ncbi:DNA repair protein RAD16 [Exophiala xenobiotica]|uniref:DNA repair protein RAD16 n=1 Tax=Lithohypha guttulata TaxID=1690604 RepID=A0ABR0JXU1_9EURO|nr:DNA repair protein RAD16 [Lithohypha guttulata]KAK5310622.1 DNA repair protein RAD16 [Exophiala xenobiotica]